MAESEPKYEVLEKIGHGSFGIIRKVRRKADGMVLCRKEISYLKMSQKEREQLHAEFQILSTLRHVNIVGYYHREHLKATQDLHLYMEYCGNGDLGRVIRELNQKNQYAEESFVWSIFAQLVTALYRCHYGVDPPEVGKNVLGLGTVAKPKELIGGVTILHRDLKPENVFLGEDNSVKLGDFGLAKMIQSHDFASTYVGTPFYMSPEICAAEKYTLKSDIWSLGCIIYELCAREPPFNAKSHYQLVQKIKEGKVAPLPVVYSPELCAVVRDCLKVNPDRRPDTAALLNLPVVRLMRKEKEVVEMSKILKVKEEQLDKRIREMEREMERKAQIDKALMREEIDAVVRREWEVKARLEIDRLVNAELEHLQKTFEQEVRSRVEMELLKAKKAMAAEAESQQQQQQQQEQEQHQTQILASAAPHLPPPASSLTASEMSSSVTKSDYMQSSIGDCSGDGDFPSTTDITELSINEPSSIDSPSSQDASTITESSSSLAECSTLVAAAPATAALARRQQQQQLPQQHNAPTRTPFGRAQTMFVGTPMDVEMPSPSPMAIASLALSPRRNGATKAPMAHQSNIFAIPPAGLASGSDDPRWNGPRESSELSDWDSDDEVVIPSPTRMIKSRKNPFPVKKGGVMSSGLQLQQQQQQQPDSASQKAAPLFGRVRAAKGGFESGISKTVAGVAATTVGAGTGAGSSSGGLRERCVSPSRRLSKIPSAVGAAAGTAATTAAVATAIASLGSSSEALEAAGGRTLTRKASFGSKDIAMEVSQVQPQQQQQQQQATGLISKQKPGIRGRTLVELQQARAGGRPLSAAMDSNGHMVLNQVSPKRPFREHATAANRGGSSAGVSSVALEPPAVWDPEKDDMPSPFLVRRKTTGIKM